MTAARDLLTDAFQRVHELVPSVVEGLTRDQLVWRPHPEANSIGWLVWHLIRIQDDHVSGVVAKVGSAGDLGAEQVWRSTGWADRFALPYPPGDTGYGHSAHQVGEFTVTGPELLVGYQDDVHRRTLTLIDTLDDVSLDTVVDDRWDPPVTAGVRLVSVLGDAWQHLGQAAYVRGLLERTA